MFTTDAGNGKLPNAFGGAHPRKLSVCVYLLGSDTPTRFREPAKKCCLSQQSWRVRHTEKPPENEAQSRRRDERPKTPGWGAEQGTMCPIYAIRFVGVGLPWGFRPEPPSRRPIYRTFLGSFRMPPPGRQAHDVDLGFFLITILSLSKITT